MTNRAEVVFLFASIRAIRGQTGFREQVTSREIMVPQIVRITATRQRARSRSLPPRFSAATVSDHRWLVRSRLVLVHAAPRLAMKSMTRVCSLS